MRAQFIVSEIGLGLRRNLTMTISVIVTVTVSMFFLGGAMLLRSQVELSKRFWYGEIELSVFLCGKDSEGPGCAGGAVTPQQRDQLLTDLQANPEVERVTYESQQEAYAHFREQFKDSPLAQTVTPDQLPESFRVKLKDPQRYDIVARQFQGRPGVENLQDFRELLDPLFGFLNALLLGAFGFAVITLVAAALQIFNTIRLAAFNRRRETGIMRLVGASRFYIQLPFVLEGIIAALIGTLLAFGALTATFMTVKPWLERHVHLTAYISTASLWHAFGIMLVVGVSIAAVASWLTLRRYLRV